VVGGGPVAARKVRALLDAGARVTVVAPRISPDVEALAEVRAAPATAGRTLVALRRRRFLPSDLDDQFLVITATDDPSATRAVVDQARARGVLVNAADDPERCDFILPAVVQRGAVQVAVTTGGQSPALARHLRDKLDDEIPGEYEPLAQILASIRAELRDAGVRVAPEVWQRAIANAPLDALRAGDIATALSQLREALTSPERDAEPDGQPPGRRPRRSGRVVLVGAGPGDPGLLTLAGRDALNQADVVIYDRLVNRALLSHARAGAELIYAGKRRGGESMTQDTINDLICQRAMSGQIVVRLKGGDPFVFGRGGEEALAALSSGIPCTVIPGVSAAIAVPAYAGIPVTHRGLASSFTVLTGHEDPSKLSASIDWDSLARQGGTLVLLMGVNTLTEVCARLMKAGLAADLPAAVIQDGTLDSQNVVMGSLSTIAELARGAGVSAPATTVIGSVVDLAASLRWWSGACTVAESPEP